MTACPHPDYFASFLMGAAFALCLVVGLGGLVIGFCRAAWRYMVTGQ